jgi:type IV pilus assembly protein PilA
MKRTNGSKRQLGQGMTEYIIIVALIAIASFIAFNSFGKAVRQEVASIALGLSGKDGGTEGKNAQTSAQNAATDAETAKATDTAAKGIGEY